MDVKECRTQKEIDREIRQMRRIFSAVKLLEADQVNVLPYGGSWGCCAIGGDIRPCDRCVGREALRGHTRCSGLQRLGNSLYEITAVWLQVEGRECVLEIYQKMEEGPIQPLRDLLEPPLPALPEPLRLPAPLEDHDPLTGSWSRAYCEKNLLPQKLTGGVAQISLDHLEAANDLYDRNAGDALLKTAADIIRQNMGKEGQLVRYSGKEMLLLLPGIQRPQLSQKLEELRMQLSAAEVPGYAEACASASIGSVWVEDTETAVAVQQAGILLKNAVRQKNSVVTADPVRKTTQDYRQSVLVVDDSALNRKILCRILSGQFDTAEASSGEECLHMLDACGGNISAVLLDIHMTGIDGFSVLEAMHQRHLLERMPVLMISTEDNVDSIRRAFDLGASDYVTRPFDARVVYRRVTSTLKLYTREQRLRAIVEDQVYETEHNSQMMIDLLNHVMEKRNGEGREHVRRIQIITAMLLAHVAQKTERYELTPAVRRRIVMAAALLDVGKMQLEDRLLESSELTPEDDLRLQKHTVLGAELVEKAGTGQSREFLQTASSICRWHHERYDGSGYPDGLRGEQIPIAAQVVGMADVYEGLTNPDNGQTPYSAETARHVIHDTMIGKFGPLLQLCLLEIGEPLAKALEEPDKQLLW